MSRLLITANSPGEMAGWVRPILKEWHQRGLGPADILLLPCSFATGQEERVARSLPGVDRVYKPSEYPRLLLKDGRDYQSGNLLHLGGDLMYSAFLNRRWGMKCWSYLWARPWWDSSFTGYFTKDDWGVNWLKKRRVSEEKIHLTGDLILDSVRQHVAKPSLTKELQISYLPGSRSHEVAGLGPFFLALHHRLQETFPGLTGCLHLSPFIPRDKARQLLESEPDPMVGGLKGVVEDTRFRHGNAKLTIVTDDHYERLSQSMLAVSIPGTKTAEAGYLRTPVLTLVPLNRPEHLPSIGLTGLLDFLPGGAHVKGQLLLRLKPHLGLLAHPNILARRALLPEVVEELRVDPLARLVETLIKGRKKLRDVSESLQNLYPWEGQAAQKIVSLLTPPTSNRRR